MNDQRDFEVILNSRFPLVAVETHEETRLITMVERVANIRSHALFVWSLTDGLRRRNHSDLNAVRGAMDFERDTLTSVLSANMTQVSLRQNEDMRKISAYVAIAAIPTLLAGIWGMNFEHMPEIRAVWGYPLALGLMIGIGVFLYWRFKKSGWL